MARRPWSCDSRGLRAVLCLVAALPVLAALGGCDDSDPDQARICRDVIPAADRNAGREAGEIEFLDARSDPGHRHGVIVHYRLSGDAPSVPPHWIRCRFAGGGFSRGRGQITAIATDRRGQLGDVALFMVRRFWLGRFETQTRVRAGTAATASTPLGAIGYGLQQALNAAVAGGIYGLLALAYTLVFAIVKRINMAFGELAMVGAYAAMTAVVAVTAMATAYTGANGVNWAMTAAFAAGTAAAAFHGWASERLIFRPLRDSRSQAVLIATVGLAIVLQEAIRMSQGARERWLQPVLGEPLAISIGGPFALTLTPAKIAVVMLVAVLFAGLQISVMRGRFGRAWRACADDAGMAALCGVNVGRTISRTFVVSGAYAGIAGVIIAIHYGGVGFTMGTVLGFKALTAAVVGGIGSLFGAMLGGLLIGAVETLWSAYLPVAGRDIAVFALLAFVLVLRPHGLLGLGPSRDSGPYSRP